MWKPRMCSVYYSFFLVLLVEVGLAQCSFDKEVPYVRKSPSSGKDGFGYAVLLHQIQIPNPGDFNSFLDNTRLIVGAPQGTYPGGLDILPELHPVNETGLVYQCPLLSPGMCDGILGNHSASSPDRRLFDGDPNELYPNMSHPLESKSGQLMGSVLLGSNNFFMACAPRWSAISQATDIIDDRRPVGRCFISPRNLKGFQVLSPCLGTMADNPVQTGMTDSQCLSGFSASIIDQENEMATVVVATLGIQRFNGDLQYYNVSAGSNNHLGMTTGREGTNISYVYEGYSTTTGYITNRDDLDVITGVPRFDGNFLTGAVRIRSQSNLTGDTVIRNISGLQTGEYFGYALAAADLTNNGYDDLIVGAPIYSTSNAPEVGRIFIFENIDGNLNTTPIIVTGRLAPSGRFGSSIVRLGDINNDGYEDIAVGAPYETNQNTNNSGVVYICYGRSFESGLLSCLPKNTINATEIVQRVPGLTSLRTFGFSLSSGVDVDGNKYNDLLVGAPDSGTSILFRSLSRASITVQVSTNVDMVQLDTSGNTTSSFIVQVCANYSGRGLDGRPLNTTLLISEVLSNGVPRLYFQNVTTKNSMTASFVFERTGRLSCLNVTAFVQPINQLRTGVDVRAPLQVEVSFPFLQRPTPTYTDGRPTPFIDYRDFPLLEIGGSLTASVNATVDCSRGEDTKCNPDLIISLLDITYFDSQGNSLPWKRAVKGETSRANIELMYDNIGPDPAFGARFSFTLPERFTHTRVDVPNNTQGIMCQLDDMRTYYCNLPNFILPQMSVMEDTRITLVWTLTGTFIGNEPTDISNITIGLPPSSQDREVNLENNNLLNGPLQIVYAAIADLAIEQVVFMGPSTYKGTAPSDTQSVSGIGQLVQLRVQVRNNGPSASKRSILNIYLPTNDTADSFYLYPIKFNETFAFKDAGINCSGKLDPQGLRSQDRTRRSLSERQTTTPAPQLGNGIIKNCSDPVMRNSCTRLRCTIGNLIISATARVVIDAALDERFFKSQTKPFIFVAYADITNDSFVEDNDPADNKRMNVPRYTVTKFEEAGNGPQLPIWIPIVCSIVAVIIIVLLFVLLYCIGFFRRKKHEDTKEAEGDFDVPAPSDPANQDSGGEPLPEKVDLNSESAVEPAKPEEPVSINPDDIGDTADLQDGNINTTEKDADETSL